MKSEDPTLFLAVTSLCVLSAPVWLAAQQPGRQKPRRARYNITDLGSLGGGPYSEATYVTNNGLVSLATLPNGTQHATLWYKALKL